MQRIKNNIFLILIILLAFSLRIYQIDNTPPSLNWDEVSLGYNAYSILQTGRDEWGVSFPTIFRAYGDYKLPAYVYLSIPGIAVFGLNEFAVRLPSVIAGTLSVLFTYLLVNELFRNKNQSLATLSAFLMAIEPWSLFTSRIALEADVAAFFVISGTYFFLKGLRTVNYLLFAPLFFGLSVWSYNSARVFTPLFVFSLILVFRKDLLRLYLRNKLIIICSLFIAILLFVPMFWQLTHPVGQARYGEVEILDSGAIAKINEARSNGCPRIQCNKVTFFVSEFAKNYVSHFNPSFLFFAGGSNYQFSIPNLGIMHLVNLPFFYLGIVLLLTRLYKYKYAKLILFWLILAPIPSSLTREAPHVLRSIVILPVPMILSSIGINFLVTRLRPVLFIAYCLLLFISLESYFGVYFGKYRSEYSWSWQYGYKEVINYVKENHDKYDKIIISKKYGEPHEFLLFYWPWNPGKYRNDPNLNRFYQSNWWWVDRFDKFYFVNDWQIVEGDRYDFTLESKVVVKCSDPELLKLVETDEIPVHCLLVTSVRNVPEGWTKLKTINFLDDTTAFEIYEN
ncbi:hypothetical protein A2691_00565 [Candidatus Woesebacteria bacterium RIFCSPHIGHO2_01_FULL_39_23]|nr:MAG: hypothetical protein A2691_00565 [Candidatus Woesebacteria bacterium RIFCSPHIGHO2_01_FULL_39_23]